MSDQHIDLDVLWRAIRRKLVWIVILTISLGLAVYFWSNSRPPVYQASASLILVGSQNQGSDAVLGAALVKAPPLPEGALAQALQSSIVMNPLLQNLKSLTHVPSSEKSRLIIDLTRELSDQRLTTLTLTSRLDQQTNDGNGVYTITAKARTATAATSLANLASDTLLNWDRNRALDNVRRAEAGFRSQIGQIDQRLKQSKSGSDDIERQTLIARRANLLTSLSNVIILENSASGVLSRLSDAVPPSRPRTPQPLKDGILAALLGLFLSSSLIAIASLLDRTVRNEDDLLGLDIPTLAVIPLVSKREILKSGMIRVARKDRLYESLGFLRVNIAASLVDKQKPILMITSTAPREGKSSLTSMLADGFAGSGQRVLLIDADLRRGNQSEIWRKFDELRGWKQLAGIGGARNLREALVNPDNVEVLQVAPNVDLLPSGPGLHDSLTLLNRSNIDLALRLWSQNYDIVILDSPPLLAVADTIVLGRYVDAVLVICEYGQTNIKSLEGLIRRAERNSLKLIGCVINKSNLTSEDGYNYGYVYNYAPRSDNSAAK